MEMDMTEAEVFALNAKKTRLKSDGCITKTFSDQEECEQSCLMFLFPFTALPIEQQIQLQALEFVNQELQPLLMREKHVEYLKRGLTTLPAGFVSLDASRPWICYWILHSLALLDVCLDDYVDRAIHTLTKCWHPDGGFGGGPGQIGHTATTYAACLALADLGSEKALEAVDRQALHRFFLTRKHRESGAFSAHEGGEVDVRVTYCVVSIASLYGILTDELAQGVVEYVVSCQTYEGGFGGEPHNEAHGGYAFCALATLSILNALERVDLPVVVHWLSYRQMPFEGGYQGRTNKLVDGCYSFWQGALPAILHQQVKDVLDCDVYQCNREQLQKYILLCGQQIEGGLRDKPGKPRDHYHTCYCLSGLSIAQHGDGTGEPFVVGDPSNLVVSTDPVYNISKANVAKTKAYFEAQGPFVP